MLLSGRSGDKLESDNDTGTSSTGKLIDARKHSRFKVEVDVKVYSRDSSRVVGHSVDVSQQGLAVMLQIEIPLDQVVRLEFELPLGLVSIRALVRQRNAFRYGFQFVEPDSYAQELINRFCHELKLRNASS
jgi:c-di-GMP-binding flagellar brake protein YcgR